MSKLWAWRAFVATYGIVAVAWVGGIWMVEHNANEAEERACEDAVANREYVNTAFEVLGQEFDATPEQVEHFFELLDERYPPPDC